MNKKHLNEINERLSNIAMRVRDAMKDVCFDPKDKLGGCSNGHHTARCCLRKREASEQLFNSMQREPCSKT